MNVMLVSVPEIGSPAKVETLRTRSAGASRGSRGGGTGGIRALSIRYRSSHAADGGSNFEASVGRSSYPRSRCAPCFLMTMALAVAMVACQGAAGTDGKDAGVAPQTVNGGIPDQSVEAGGSNTIDLAPHFTDPNGDDAKLKYKPAALNAATATAEVSGMNLTVNGIKAGMTTITVTATDGEGLDTKSTFKVTVTTPQPQPQPQPPEPTDPPEPGANVAPVASTIPAQSMMTGADPLVVNLSPFFTDADDDELTFSDPVSSNPAAATVELSDSTLTITAVAAGMSTISVTATDPGDLSVMGSVELTVSDPPTMNVAPVVSTIPAQSMMTGADPLVMNLSPFFTDADDDELTFSDPVSSNPAAATVELSDSTLTITAVAAGMSTISVTATDPGDLSVMGSVELTVSDPSISIPPTIELQKSGIDANLSEEFELPSGYTLQTADSSKVNVVRTGATGEGNEWRITARAKTDSVDVFVNDENNDYAQTIAVTVLNSLPVRRADVKPSKALLPLTLVDVGSEYPDGARYDPPITIRILYRTSDSIGAGLGDLTTFYTDADGDSLSFEIDVAEPHKGLILFKLNDEGRLHKGTNNHVLYADILTERIDRPIEVNIYAHDGDDKSAEAVFFELRNNKPIPRNDGHTTPITGNQAYLLTQLQEPGFFRDETYGNRTGVDHIFQFGHTTKMVGGVPVFGFAFAHDFLERLVEDGFSIGIAAGASLGDSDHRFSVGGSATDIAVDGRVRLDKYDPAVAEDLGAIYYSVDVGGPITQSGDDVATIDNFVKGSAESRNAAVTLDDSTYPEIKFRFNSVGTGTLTITFGVWADEDGDGSKTAGWQTESRGIDFRIDSCTSIDRIEDCP